MPADKQQYALLPPRRGRCGSGRRCGGSRRCPCAAFLSAWFPCAEVLQGGRHQWLRRGRQCWRSWPHPTAAQRSWVPCRAASTVPEAPRRTWPAVRREAAANRWRQWLAGWRPSLCRCRGSPAGELYRSRQPSGPCWFARRPRLLGDSCECESCRRRRSPADRRSPPADEPWWRCPSREPPRPVKLRLDVRRRVFIAEAEIRRPLQGPQSHTTDCCRRSHERDLWELHRRPPRRGTARENQKRLPVRRLKTAVGCSQFGEESRRACPGRPERETRSEERRVGKEGRSRWSPYH